MYINSCNSWRPHQCSTFPSFTILFANDEEFQALFWSSAWFLSYFSCFGKIVDYQLTTYWWTTIYSRKSLQFLHFPLINFHMLEKVWTWLIIFSLQLKSYFKIFERAYDVILRLCTLSQECIIPDSVQSIKLVVGHLVYITATSLEDIYLCYCFDGTGQRELEIEWVRFRE